MDLGCLDLGCVSFLDGCNSRNKDDGTKESVSAAPAKVGKHKSPKESPQSNSSTVNRSTSQMKKPPSRKTSPINWFPRKKVDSYLKRKIKLLQETGGMNSTLDETLGDANPHYCRVEREKIAVKEAARKAMEARKAAMVEASWCRILKAARINSKEAEAFLLIAEKNVAEALEAATAKGVIMYSTSDCTRNKCVIQTSPANGKATTTTHTVRASFETAFEVDKQVAAAVKTAFIQLANSPSSLNKDEYHDLLRKISENPDTDTADNQELSEFSSGCESDMGFEAEMGSPDTEARQRKYRRRQSPQKSNTMNLVEMMFERLKCLKEEELASLATIVATSGLSAVLAEVGNNHKTPDEEGTTRRRSDFGAGTIRSSSIDFFMNGPTRKKQVVQRPEFPSLDKVLVKHVTKLEREVQEARNLRVKESREGCELDPDRLEDLNVILEEDEIGSSETASDFEGGHIKDFEVTKEKEEMKRNHEKPLMGVSMKFRSSQLQKNSQIMEENREVPSLDKFLVKHVTRLEREVQEARNLSEKESRVDPDRPEDLRVILEEDGTGSSSETALLDFKDEHVKDFEDAKEKEEMKRNHEKPSKGAAKKFQSSQLLKNSQIIEENREVPSLDKFLVKHVTRLEREVQEARNLSEKESRVDPDRPEDLRVILEEDETGSSETALLDLKDEHVEDFEDAKEKEERKRNHEKPSKGAAMKFRSSQLRKKNQIMEENRELPSLDKFLVKHVTRLEREVQEAKNRRKESPSKVEGDKENIDLNTKAEITTGSRNGALPYTGTGKDDSNFESLDKVLIKHVPRLEIEKMELRAKEEGLKVEKKDKALQQDQNGDCGLDQILLKHKSRLEREKEQMVAAAQESEQGQPPKYPSITHKEARERELQEFWGGKSLGDSVRPHVSRLERERAVAQPVVIGDEKTHSVSRRKARERELEDAWGGMGLGNSLLPKFPRLEREKAAAQPSDVGDEKSYSVSRREAKQRELQEAWGGMDLGNSMRPQVSRLEREKAAAAQSADVGNEKTYSASRREARERELQEAWRGMGLGTMSPQVSRLEREKAAAAQSADVGNEKTYSASRREARERELQEAWRGMGLGTMSPQVSRLEREKAAAARSFVDEKNHSISRKEARQRELQEAWGGVGLGNSMRPHVSRLEREKAAWMKAEEEERRATAIPGL